MADGDGCTCMAYGPYECVCDADWTPQEIYDLRGKLCNARGFLLALLSQPEFTEAFKGQVRRVLSEIEGEKP